MEPITLNPEVTAPEPEAPISLNTGGPTPAPLSEEVIAQRSERAATALENTPAVMSRDELKSYIAAGQENAARLTAASTLNEQQVKSRAELVREVLNSSPELDFDKLKWLEGTTPVPYVPDDIFERRAAENQMELAEAFAQKEGDKHFWNIAKESPAMNDVEAMKKYGSFTMARYNVLATLAEEVKAKIDSQSWLDWGLDMGKMAFPWLNPYYELKMRGNVEGTTMLQGGLLGENLEQQRDALWNLPYEQFVPAARKIIEGLAKDNPLAAMSFLQAMMGQSSVDKATNNFNTLFNIGDVAGLGKVGWNVARTAHAVNQTNKAIKQIMQAGMNPNATKADILASIGDLPASAREGAAQIIVNRIAGSTTPTEEGMDALGRFFRMDRKAIENDASLSEAQKAAIMQQYDAREASILQVLASTMRPGISLEDASREVIESIQKSTFNRYPGMKNALIRMTDPFYEPLSSRWFLTGWIGRRAGELFSDEVEAANYALAHNMRVSLSPDQIAVMEARITDLEAQLKQTPRMDEDAAGMNRYYKLEDELKGLKERKEMFKQPGGYRIGDTGLGHYIEVTAPIKETDHVVRQFLYDPKNVREANSTPESITDWIPYINKARTAEDTLSKENRANRKAAVYPQAILRGLQMEEAKVILRDKKAMTRAQWREFQDVLKWAQDEPDPDDGLPGYYFKDNEGLKQHYLTTYGRAPTEAETEAFFAVKRWNEFDRVMREVHLYSDKSRLGAETHRVVVNVNGQKITSPEFDGVSKNELPKGRGNLLIIDDSFDNARVVDADESPVKNAKVTNITRMTTKQREQYNDLISQGVYKLIEIYDPELRPFNGLVKNGEKRIQHVLARSTEQRPLTWEQVPRRGGGHLVYDYPQYIKQANIVSERVDSALKHWYEGDNTLMPIDIHAKGVDIAKHMNIVREWLRQGKVTEAKKYFDGSPLPMDWKEVKSWFSPSKTPEGKFVPARFNLNEEFKVVPRNKTIFDMDNDIANRYGPNTLQGGTFIDGTREGSLARNFQVEFTGERDARGLFTLENTGTVQNPVYNVRPAEKVTPLQVLNRSTSRIINSTFMDGYKNFAVESWLQEAKPFLKEANKVDYAPFYHFKTATADSFRSAVPVQVVDKFLANKFKIEQLVGTPTKTQVFMHTWSQAAADLVYTGLGPKAAEIVPIWKLSGVTDPFTFMRSMAFNAYLGAFAIPQLFVQMATYVNMFAYSPRYTVAGTSAALLHGWSRMSRNPAILAKMDALAVKLSKMPGMVHWKPGEWTEGMELLERSGFRHVGDEYIGIDNITGAKILPGPVGQFFSWGRAPFRAGEKSTRIGAWYTAFKEFREAQPHGRVTNADLKKITDRADFLYGNMSSASSSTLHTGALSLPAQFYAYTIRLAEAFLTKNERLGKTRMDRSMIRARLLATNAAMFGIPMSAGVTGLPLSNFIREEAIERGLPGSDRGYTVNRTDDPNASAVDWLHHLIMEGAPATAIKKLTGSNVNFGQRFGSGGFETLRSAFFEDAGLWSLMGAAPQFVVDTFFHNMKPLGRAMTALVTGDTNYPLKAEDFIAPIKSVSSVSRSRAYLMALNTGQWISKNGEKVKDVGPFMATFMYVTGMSPQEQADARHMKVNLKDQQENIIEGSRELTKEVNSFLLSMDKGDIEQATDYLRRADAVGIAYGLDNKQRANSIARAMKNKGSLVNRVAWERLILNAPADKKEQFRKMYSDIYKASQDKKKP